MLPTTSDATIFTANKAAHFEDVAGPAGARRYELRHVGQLRRLQPRRLDGHLYKQHVFERRRPDHFQPEFQTEGTEEVKAVYQRMAAGNTLLRESGDGTFRDVSSRLA